MMVMSTSGICYLTLFMLHVLLQHDSALASMSQHAHGILPKAMADQRPVHHSADRAHARHAL